MMHIPVLKQLETRPQWLAYLRRERPLAYVLKPLSLVDCQSTYLQITCLQPGQLDGRQALKYSVGARYSLAPVWQLIKGCNWQLSTIVAGLNELDFAGNVRDNSFLGRHTELSVRKFYSKDKHLLSPLCLGELPVQRPLPRHWQLDDITALLSQQQYRQIIFAPDPHRPAPVKSILLRLLADQTGWQLAPLANGWLALGYAGQTLLKINPDPVPPPARLKSGNHPLNGIKPSA